MKGRFFSLVLVLVAVLCASTASAKDFKFMPSVDGGIIWFFLYDNGADRIVMDPAPAYGGSVVQIIDFEWARNMAAELSYHHSKSRGEWDPLNGDKFIFDLTCDYATANVAYFFSGRRLHPYISGGFGSAWFKYERENGDKIWETDFTINAGGGVDVTLVEKIGAMEQINVGVRVRYIYVFPHKIVDTGMGAVPIMFRFQLRF